MSLGIKRSLPLIIIIIVKTEKHNLSHAYLGINFKEYLLTQK